MIDGIWHLISGEQDGVDLPESDITNSKLKIVGNTHEVTVGDTVIKGVQSLDTDQSPITIDSHDSEGPFAGQTTLGICKLEDDVFSVCFAAPGEERPTEFTTKDGKATILHVWKRDS